jgi:hypothetical protein
MGVQYLRQNYEWQKPFCRQGLREIKYILRLLSPKGTRYVNVPRNDKDLKFL